MDDSEYRPGADPNVLRAIDSTPAAGQMDLLTVVMHELGHALGLPDLDGATHPGDVMDESLSPGTRRLPTSSTPLASRPLPVALASGVQLTSNAFSGRPLRIFSRKAGGSSAVVAPLPLSSIIGMDSGQTRANGDDGSVPEYGGWFGHRKTYGGPGQDHRPN